ncbi:hypothetical protein GCM10009530_42460 [Microbispora corallina]|uniref:Lipoprotein n=1 Tax=Microbispora corallina TaxID=83302 RepID=A0ABQ4G1B4_9ACTN|nr:hypothetical protein [Microbispora corallina]GIH40825.1 hypothetical protein Mco01_38250 [Microbispora corallina]
MVRRGLALVVAGILLAGVGATPAQAAGDRPLTAAEIKKALLARKDLGKGWLVLAGTYDGARLSTYRVDVARCADALTAYDSVFGGGRPGAIVVNEKGGGLLQVLSGNAGELAMLETAAKRVGAACDGVVGFRQGSAFKKKKVARMGDATYAFEVTFDYARYAGADTSTMVSEYVVVPYRSSVIVYQGLTGKGHPTWPLTVKIAKRAVAKVKALYAKRR